MSAVNRIVESLPPGVGDTPSSAGATGAYPLSAETEIGNVFDEQDANKAGTIDYLQLTEAAGLLNERLGLGLDADDVERLYGFLGGGRVSRARFVAGVQQLTEVLRHLGERLTMKQIQVLLVTAFERFGSDGNGEISSEELAAAAVYLGLDLDSTDIIVLHRFFTASGRFNQQNLAKEPPLLQQWTDAVGVAVAQMRKEKGLEHAGKMLDRVRDALVAPGDVPSRLESAWAVVSDSGDDVCNVAESALDTAALLLAVQYIWTEWQEVQETQNLDDLDIQNVLPFFVFCSLSAVTTFKALDDAKYMKMSDEEALLYAEIFYARGFSQSEFKRLVLCPGFAWHSASTGEILNPRSDGSLRIILKGRACVSGTAASGAPFNITLPAGSLINETLFLKGCRLWAPGSVTALEPVVYVSWDTEQLQDLLSQYMDMSFQMDRLLATAMVSNIRKTAAQRSQRASTSGAFCEAFQAGPAASLDMSGKVGRFDSQELMLVLYGVFEGLDLDGDGLLSCQELETCITNMGISLSSQELRQLYGSIDSNADGVIDLSEWKTAVQSYLKSRLGLGDSDQELARLLDTIGSKGGKISVDASLAILKELDSTLQNLGGVTMQELMILLYGKFQTVDKNSDGTINPQEFRAGMEIYGPNLTEKQTQVLFAFMDANGDGIIDIKEWEGAVLTYVSSRFGQSGTDLSLKHLFAHLNLSNDKVVSLHESKTALEDLEDVLKCLGNISMEELGTIMYRSFDQLDTNNDGSISLEEFECAVQMLSLPLSKKQARVLHEYMDVDKDGFINIAEWRSPRTDAVAWFAALKLAVASQAERRGLRRFGYVLKKAGDILDGPGDLLSRAGRASAAVVDGADSIVEAASLTSDLAGVCIALSGIWREIQGLASWDDVDQLNLAPFVLFMGICSVNILRQRADGEVSDLSAVEAMLYAKAFQKEGFTVTEFHALLKCRGARLEHFEKDECVSIHPDPEQAQLRVVARGSWVITECDSDPTLAGLDIGLGGFIGGLAYIQQDIGPTRAKGGSTILRATSPATTLTMDIVALKEHLESDDALKVKMNRCVTLAMADQLLNAFAMQESA